LTKNIDDNIIPYLKKTRDDIAKEVVMIEKVRDATQQYITEERVSY
jgi:hypothetical protein